jgi:hypothetical protein
MSVNMNVSFTDCFAMTVLESLHYRIPCVISNTSEPVYHGSAYLKNNLIASDSDSPLAISERLEWVLEHYEEVQSAITQHLPVLNEEIEKTIENFLR